MKIKYKNITLSAGVPFFAVCAFFLAGEMRLNFAYAMIFSALHETGHILALLFYGRKPKNITFGFSGIRIETDSTSLSYKQESIVALCGPAVNLIFIIFFLITDVSENALVINTGLLIVNMLPVKSLDGGRFIHSLLSVFIDKKRTELIMNILAIITAFIIVSVMIFSLVTGFVNTSFILFTVFLVLVIISELIF